MMSFKCIDAVEVSLHIEKEGLVYYQKASRRAQNPKVKDIFTRLANEEKDHIHSLQEKSKFLQPTLARKAEASRELESFIAENLEGKVFPGFQSGDGAEPKNDLEALGVGIESEKRSIEVLRDLLSREKKLDVRAVFMHLMAEEQKHLKLLENIRRALVSEAG